MCPGQSSLQPRSLAKHDMTGFHLSDRATARVLAVHGERGAAWLREVPDRLAELATEWALVHLGPPFPESRASLVIPTRRQDGVPLVLKFAPAPEWVTDEAHALAYWEGRGAVRLEAANLPQGALLLERAVPGTPLAALCPDDDRAATMAAADDVLQLRFRGGAFESALPTLASWTEILASVASSPAVPELRVACETASLLAADLLANAANCVLHGDLHHHNLVRAERAPWLAIDPKGLQGPPEAEPAALLRNPRAFVLSHANPTALLLDRLDILAERLGDDPRRLAGWGYVLAVLAASWAFEDDASNADIHRWLACADALMVVARARGAA